jgi:hypothetical protein
VAGKERLHQIQLVILVIIQQLLKVRPAPSIVPALLHLEVVVVLHKDKQDLVSAAAAVAAKLLE